MTIAELFEHLVMKKNYIDLCNTGWSWNEVIYWDMLSNTLSGFLLLRRKYLVGISCISKITLKFTKKYNFQRQYCALISYNELLLLLYEYIGKMFICWILYETYSEIDFSRCRVRDKNQFEQYTKQNWTVWPTWIIEGLIKGLRT